MGKSVVSRVAGISHPNKDGSRRDLIVCRQCDKNSEIVLKREPNNPYDSNAIAVYVKSSTMFGLFKSLDQIGYIKEKLANRLAKLMDEGKPVTVSVDSVYISPNVEYPRVSLKIKY